MRILLTIFFIIGSLLTLLGQNSNNILIAYEDSLQELGPEILYGSNDSIKYAANHKFISILTKALKTPNSFDYPFDKLITIARLSPLDNTFRIFNWNWQRQYLKVPGILLWKISKSLQKEQKRISNLE